MEAVTLEDFVARRRKEIDTVIELLLSLKKELASPTTAFSVGPNEDRGEVIANVVLALRHAEDAKMRLGKVFQAIDGGVSNNPR